MRLAPVLLFGLSTMLVSAHSARLSVCTQSYCASETVSLNNLTSQPISEWTVPQFVLLKVDVFSQTVSTWFARFLPPQVPPIAPEEAAKPVKKALVVYGDSSITGYVRGLRGLNSYEYTPIEVEHLIVAPQQ